MRSILRTLPLLCLLEKALAATPLELAEHWAPVIYQDTDSTNYNAEYITRFDYDGDWQGNNNWENLDAYPQPAYVYYSVSSTSTHWIVSYMFFHPRDWLETCSTGDCHENDSEGIILWIRRDGSEFGTLELMHTQAHGYFFKYSDLPLTAGSTSLDGPMQWENGRPRLRLQSKGHGVWGHAYCGLLTFYACIWIDALDDFPGGDGVVYRFEAGRGAEVPASGNDRDVSYALLPISSFWDRRFDIGDGHTFGSFGKFDGDNHGIDSADAPWSWNDSRDGLPRGGAFYDPAYAATSELHGWGANGIGPMSQIYEVNPYGGTLSGEVADAASGLPVAGASLRLDGRGGSGASLPNGAYSFTSLPGSYTLFIDAPGYQPKQQPGIAVASLASQLQLRLELTPAPMAPASSWPWLILGLAGLPLLARKKIRD